MLEKNQSAHLRIPFLMVSSNFGLTSRARREKKWGFSLLELLVVVAIIAVLAGLAFPAFNKVMASGKAAKCLSNMKQITAITLLYANDNNGYLPPYSGQSIHGSGSVPWNQMLAPYFGYTADQKGFFSPIFKCPSDLRPYDMGGGKYARSYAMNATPSFTSTSDYRARAGLMETDPPYLGRLLSQVNQPSKTIMLSEWYTKASTGVPNTNSQNSPASSALSTGWVVLSDTPCLPNGNYYHNQLYINCTFVDGHAQPMQPADVIAGYSSSQNTLWTAIHTQ